MAKSKTKTNLPQLLPYILFLAFLLRIISLNQSLWLDEATSALLAAKGNFKFFVPYDFHPPLYYYLLFAWSKIFGLSEISLRLPSVLLGVGSVYLLYKSAFSLVGRTSAILAAIFLAISPLHIYYSQEARMYSLATFAVLLLFYSTNHILQKNPTKHKLFAFSLVLVAFSDYMAVLSFVPVFYIIFRSKKFKLLKLFIPLAVSYLLYSPIFLSQFIYLSKVSSSWANTLGHANLKNIALIWIKFLIGRISFDSNFVYATLVLIISSIYLATIYYREK
jgi:uncharacterized membrane protein